MTCIEILLPHPDRPHRLGFQLRACVVRDADRAIVLQMVLRMGWLTDVAHLDVACDQVFMCIFVVFICFFHGIYIVLSCLSMTQEV